MSQGVSDGVKKRPKWVWKSENVDPPIAQSMFYVIDDRSRECDRDTGKYVCRLSTQGNLTVIYSLRTI